MNWNPGVEVAALAEKIGMSVEVFALTLAILSVWEILWKGLGMWKAARNGQMWWFIPILALNSAGILPIIYIVFFQKEAADENKEESSTAPVV